MLSRIVILFVLFTPAARSAQPVNLDRQEGASNKANFQFDVTVFVSRVF